MSVVNTRQNPIVGFSPTTNKLSNVVVRPITPAPFLSKIFPVQQTSSTLLKAAATQYQTLAAQLEEAVRKGDRLLVANLFRKLPEVIERTLTNSATKKGDTALEPALLGLTRTVQQALVNSATKNGETLLALCIRSNNIQCFELLLDSGAIPEKTLLHLAIKESRPLFVERLLTKMSTEQRKSLLQATDDEGFTPLLLCATLNDELSMKSLLRAGADRFCKTSDGMNFLHHAVLGNRPELIASFLKAIPEKTAKELANTVNGIGLSPLLYCLFPKAGKCMNLLLNAGADPLQTNPEKATYLHLIARMGYPKLLKSFLKRISKLPPDLYAKVLNAQDVEGDTALSFSCLFNKKRCLELLLKAHADPLIPDSSGDFIYTAALTKGKTQITRILARKEPKLKGAYALLRVANAFGLEPEPLVAGKKLPFPGSSNHLEQRFVLSTLKEPLIRSKILSCCDNEQYRELLEGFTQADLRTSHADVVKRIRQGKLVIVPAGWEDHAIRLVFHNGYLVICNRGEGCSDEHGNDRTFFAHRISLDQVTEELFEKSLDLSDANVKDAMKFYYGELLRKLEVRQDDFCKKIQAISPKPIYADICAFAAPKSALRASLALLTKDPEVARDASKAWATKQREQALDVFQKTPTPFDEDYRQEFIAAQSKRLDLRKRTQLVKHLYRLKEKIAKGRSITKAMKELGDFFGLKQRKKLEACLQTVCQKKKMRAASPQFGRAMFLQRKCSGALKIEAIDMFIEQIDLDKTIRDKLNINK